MRQYRTQVVLLSALLVVAAVSCGDDGSSASPSSTTAPGATAATSDDPLAPAPLPTRTKVTIGTPGALEVFSTVYMAEALGEFEKENLDVEVVELRPNDAYLSMSQGNMEVYVAGVNAGFINVVQSGIDLRWIANTHSSSPKSEEGLWVRNELLDPSGDLRDDAPAKFTIAMGAGGLASASIVPISDWLTPQGRTLEDLEVTNLSGNDIVVALDNGAIQSGYLPSPGYQVISASGCCTLVTQQPPFTAATYAMSASFIEDDSEAAKAVIRALARTNRDYLQGDYHADDEVALAMSEVFAIPVDSLRQTEPLVFDPDLGLDVKAIDALQSLWIDVGVLDLDQPVSIDRLTDHSIVDQALGKA